ncbi:MAG: ABC transporter ATP-binding protein [Myxococcaceae bacterium]
MGVTVRLVWEAHPRAAALLLCVTTVTALLPAGIAYLGKLIVDGVVGAAQRGGAQGHVEVVRVVLMEFGLVAGLVVAQRLAGFARELLRASLGNLISEKILRKALQLELRHFEDSETYDKMQNARREASARPLALALSGLSVVQNAVTLVAYGALLTRLSGWSVLVLAVAAIPAFLAEAKMANAAFRLHSWRAPEGRKLSYLEWILTRDSHVKEVKLFRLGEFLLERYRTLFKKFFEEDRALALRKMLWGGGLGLLALAAFYGCYVWVAGKAAVGEITLGDMTLYLAVFRQGQAAFQEILSQLASTYENALFMTNLYTFLDIPVTGEAARVSPARVPPKARSHSIEFRHVSFRYPGQTKWALSDIDLRLEPGEKLGLVGENGAGKSTLVKLLMRLYDPTDGAILYGGVDLRDMEASEVRSRMSAVFQDFVRYQFNVAENIGLGDVNRMTDLERIREAARRGGVDGLIATLPKGYDTTLGGWFESGQELSAGQWQKIAVARAFMRDFEVLILDEPSASIDAEAEHELFQRLRALAAERTALIISHRFATMRIADRIAVFHDGKLVELGSHAQLLEQNGRYAHLFRLQAQGYVD